MLDSEEIKTVTRVSKDWGQYVVKCPHCGAIIGVEGEDLSEIRGEQYQHGSVGGHGCGRWLQVSSEARFVEKL